MNKATAVKRILKFLRTTLVGGLLFLAPIVVLGIVLGKALALAHKIVDPLAERLPVESVIGLRTPMLLAGGVIVLFCFLAGFFARTVLARKLVSGLEGAVLSNVPGYEFLKRMGESMLGVEKQAKHQTVLARPGNAWQIGFVIERLENGLVAVFIPSAPSPHSGAVFFLTLDRIQVVDVPEARALKCLTRHGAGADTLLRGVAIGGEPTK